MSTAIVTDSICDIPYPIAEKFNIHIVPNIIVIQGKSVQDDEHFSRQDFYAQLPDMETQPTTSTASSGAYKARIDRLRNLLQAARPFERLAILHSNAHQAYCYLRHPGHKICAEDAAGGRRLSIYLDDICVHTSPLKPD